jgi:hypothetical protein
MAIRRRTGRNGSAARRAPRPARRKRPIREALTRITRYVDEHHQPTVYGAAAYEVEKVVDATGREVSSDTKPINGR